MNRFDAAGCRAFAAEMVRRGHPQIFWAQLDLDSDAVEGDMWQAGHYLATVDEPVVAGEKTCVVFQLRPTKESIADLGMTAPPFEAVIDRMLEYVKETPNNPKEPGTGGAPGTGVAPVEGEGGGSKAG